MPSYINFAIVTNLEPCGSDQIEQTIILLGTWSGLWTGEDYPRMIHMCPEKAAQRGSKLEKISLIWSAVLPVAAQIFHPNLQAWPALCTLGEISDANLSIQLPF